MTKVSVPLFAADVDRNTDHGYAGAATRATGPANYSSLVPGKPPSHLAAQQIAYFALMPLTAHSLAAAKQ